MKLKVRNLEHARQLEAQAKAIREDMEREQSRDVAAQNDLSNEIVRIQRDADAEARGHLETLDDLFDRIEERIVPRLQNVERQVAGSTERTAEGDDSEPTERTDPDAGGRALRERGISLDAGSDSEQVAKLVSVVEQQQREIERINRSVSERIGLPGYDGTSEAKNAETKFDIVRAVGGYLNGWQGSWAKSNEKKLLDEYAAQMRALGSSVSSAGGFFVAPTWMSDVIELLRPNTVSLQLGMRTVPNLTGGPVVWPKIKGGATAYWVSEGKKATKSQLTAGSLNLTPRPIMAVTAVSEDLLEDAPNVGGVVEEDMARALGEAIDRGVMIGGGGSGEPLGIVNAPGIGTTDFSSISIPTSTNFGVNAAQNYQDVTDLLDDMIFQVAARNAYKGSPGFALHPSGAQKLRTAKDLNGRPILFDPSATDPNQAASVGLASGTMWGHSWGMSTQLAYGSVTDLLFGNWADLLLGRWGVTKVMPSMEASDGTDSAFLSAQVWIRMRARVDTGLRHGESFQIATGWAN